MAKPLCLVSWDEDTGKFSVGEGAEAALRALGNAPVAVLTVAGRARGGKSFLLNLIAKEAGTTWIGDGRRGGGRTDGGGEGRRGGTEGEGEGSFAVGSTHRPCTRGLWMWGNPAPLPGSSSAHGRLVLLDTEGVDAWNRSSTYSAQLFTLATLLSSCLVYNQVGGVDEAAIDSLGLVAAMTGKILHDEGGGEAADSFVGPDFVWLLRDFWLDLSASDGRGSTPAPGSTPIPAAATDPDDEGDAYLSEALSGPGDARRQIRRLFPRRGCSTLVRPAEDEADLRNLAECPADRLRPAFRAGLARLSTRLRRLVADRPKRVGGSVVTGPALAGLVRCYVDALNGGAVPEVASSWRAVADRECARAAEAALDVYAGALAEAATENAEDDPVAEAAEAERRARTAAEVAYSEAALGDADVAERGLASLRSRMDERRTAWMARAESAAEGRAEAAVAVGRRTLTAVAVDANASTADVLGATVDAARAALDAGGARGGARVARWLADEALGGTVRPRAAADATRLREAAQAAEAARKDAETARRDAAAAGARLEAETATGRGLRETAERAERRAAKAAERAAAAEQRAAEQAARADREADRGATAAKALAATRADYTRAEKRLEAERTRAIEAEKRLAEADGHLRGGGRRSRPSGGGSPTRRPRPTGSGAARTSSRRRPRPCGPSGTGGPRSRRSIARGEGPTGSPPSTPLSGPSGTRRGRLSQGRGRRRRPPRPRRRSSPWTVVPGRSVDG